MDGPIYPMESAGLPAFVRNEIFWIPSLLLVGLFVRFFHPEFQFSNLFTAAPFYVWVMVWAIVFQTASRFCSAPGRNLLLLGIGTLTLSMLVDWQRILALEMFFSLLIVGIGLSLRHLEAPTRRKLTLIAGICFVIIVSMIFRYPKYTAYIIGEQKFLDPLKTIEWAGLSYLTLRAVDLLVVANSRHTKTFNPLMAFSFLMFFIPFISGPVNRFNSFVADQSKPFTGLNFAEWRDSLIRISIGVIKILFLAKMVHQVSAPELSTVGASKLQLLLGFYFYLFYIYLDFSGYCDVVIGFGRLYGLKIPENFNFPFLAPNLQDFWNRWHISFAHWSRDYLFFPLLRFLTIQAKAANNLVILATSIFVTFLFMGAWHGDGVQWFYYGLYHGVGMTIWILYSKGTAALFPDGIRRLQKNLVYRISSTFLTFNFVAFGLILTLDMQRAQFLFRQLLE